MSEDEKSSLAKAIDEAKTDIESVRMPWTDTLRALGVDELRAWMVERVSLQRKENKILAALEQQLQQVEALHGRPEALEPNMKQAKHMRDEVLALRSEKSASPTSGPTPIELRGALVELEQLEGQLFQMKDQLHLFEERFERAFRVLGKLAP